MNTLTSNTQTTATYNLIAQDVIQVFDDLGFTVAEPIDPAAIQSAIVEAVRNRLEGNVNYAQATG